MIGELPKVKRGILPAVLISFGLALLVPACGGDTVLRGASSIIRITNAPETLNLTVGEEFQLQVIQFFTRRDAAGGEFVDSVDVTTLVRYSSSNPAVATVDNLGRVNAVGVGQAVIEAKLKRTFGRDDLDSITVVVSMPPAPPAPHASDYQFPDRIVISWPLQIGASQVELYRSTEPNDPSPTLLATLSGNTISFTDSSVTPGMVYFYRIRFIFGNVQGEMSPPDSGIAGTFSP